MIYLFGTYQFLAAASYGTSVACFLLAILVFCANPRSRSCRLAVLFKLSISFWAFFYASMFFPSPPKLGLLICRLLILGSIFVTVFFTHFVLVIVKKERTFKWVLWLDYVFAFFLIGILFATRLFVVGTIAKLDLPSYADGRPLYLSVPIFMSINVVFSCIQLFRGIVKAKGYRKSQLTIFLLGAGFGFAMGMPGYLLVFDIPFKPVTTPLVIIYPLLVAYGIIKHRFLDIQKLLKNTVVFSLLFLSLLAVVSGVLFILKDLLNRKMGVSEPVAQGAAIALAMLIYGPLKRFLSRLTSRLLYQQQTQPEVIFSRLSRDLLKITEADKLASHMTQRLSDILALECMTFYVRSKKTPSIFECRANVGRCRKKDIHQSKQLVQDLEHRCDYLVNPYGFVESRMLSRQKQGAFALKNWKEIKQAAILELAALGGVACFPIFIKNILAGFVLVGAKKSDAPWRAEEFGLLKSFMQHFSLAFANAEYVEAIRGLRRKIATSERDASAGALIAGVDHEVKNPLHAMSLELSALKANLTSPRFLRVRSTAEKAVTAAMAHVLQDVTSIHEIIRHLSDLADRKPLQICEDVVIGPVCERAVQEITALAGTSHVAIRQEIADNFPLTCDTSALHEILVNLVLNAAQAITGRGTIVIRAFKSKGEACVEIEDTGSGIPAGCLEKIFEPFFTTKDRRGSGGTGMGLFIAREFMQAMGGEIRVRSQPGQGAVFSLIFPEFLAMGAAA